MSVGREQIAEAAFALFAVQGYESTSVDDIASRAGISRSTFFRWYGSKEAVVFPDHDFMLGQVESRLASTHNDSALAGVVDAVKIVLFHYVAEGSRARERYQLTSTVPVLRDRELVSTARYQNLFRRHLNGWGGSTPEADLQADVTAAAVVAAHNHVLRQWLRGKCEDPQRDITAALDLVLNAFERHARGSGIALVVLPQGVTLQQAGEAIRGAALTPSTESPSPPG